MSAEQVQPESIEVARCVVGSLVACGVRDVVYSPGSRCAPFAYALAQAEVDGVLRVHVRLDERGAAFFAVGLSRAGVTEDGVARPVALIGTSGGAIAEYHAGVAEAFHSRLPLVVVSADRPFEMRGVGASQTTSQAGIFASHTRGVWDVPAGDAQVHRVQAVLGRAVARALGRPSGCAGPVHVNVALRDPLVPSAWPFAESFVVPSAVEFTPVRRDAWAWERCVVPSLRTVIIAGDGAGREAAGWAESAQVPLLAEPTSGVTHSLAWVPFQQAFLQPGSVVAEDIEQVVVVGRPTLSRPVSRTLARSDVRVVVVSDSDEWVDVAGTAALVVPDLLPPERPHEDTAWLGRWREVAELARERLECVLVSQAAMSIAHVAQGVWEAPVATLLLGASNTIRAVDLVASVPAQSTVVSNRGLAGIDGTIATAFGLARGSGAPVRALMGDLTFFHDVSSLALSEPESAPDVHIVVVDDDGGGIFASLEHGRPVLSELYSRWFATTQRADIGGLAAAYGATYSVVSDVRGLGEELARPIRGVHVTHVRIPRPDALFVELKSITTDTSS